MLTDLPLTFYIQWYDLGFGQGGPIDRGGMDNLNSVAFSSAFAVFLVTLHWEREVSHFFSFFFLLFFTCAFSLSSFYSR